MPVADNTFTKQFFFFSVDDTKMKWDILPFFNCIKIKPVNFKKF